MDFTTIINIFKYFFAFLREIFIGGHFDTGGRYKLLKTCIIFIFLFSLLLNIFLIKISLNMSKEILNLRELSKKNTNLNKTIVIENTKIDQSVQKPKKKINDKKNTDNKLRGLKDE